MKKKLFKNIVAFATILLVTAPVLSLALVLPVSADVNVWGPTDINNEIGLGTRDPRDIAANVINIILGFLGIIAVIIILIGGFKWMTAGGNEDKVSEARKLIVAGVIGLVIILASYGIATFVLSSLINATNANG